jgi:DNA-directed RNA polymerase subunit beta'
VEDGKEIEAGDELTEGSINPHDLLEIKGLRAVQDYMIREVQKVYRLQGVDINDKHIEMIVRQMLKKIKVESSGDSNILPGTTMDILEFDDINEKLLEKGLRPAEGKRVMFGITKASLATNSFMSAASFQETTKVLTEAAINGKIDPLIGLKENVLIGKLIPAGTGMHKYGDVELDTDGSDLLPEEPEEAEAPEEAEESGEEGQEDAAVADGETEFDDEDTDETDSADVDFDEDDAGFEDSEDPDAEGADADEDGQDASEEEEPDGDLDEGAPEAEDFGTGDAGDEEHE